MNDDELREELRRAVELTADLPAETRGPLAAELVRWFLGGRASGPALGHPRLGRARSAPPVEPAEHPALVEVLAEIGIRTHAETVVAILSYRLRFEAIDEMSADEIGQTYREVRLPKPQNISDTIAKAMRRGWVVGSTSNNGKRTWRVTALGLRAFDGWRVS